jgi:hypothetical protein
LSYLHRAFKRFIDPVYATFDYFSVGEMSPHIIHVQLAVIAGQFTDMLLKDRVTSVDFCADPET